MVNLGQVLSTAEDIVLLEKLKGDKWTFAVPLQGGVAKHYFNQAFEVLKQAGVDTSESNTFHTYDPEAKKIRGSSTNFCVVLDAKMRPDGFWLPGVVEAKTLDRVGKLSNNTYRDLGIAVYNDENPNKETSQKIIAQATGKELPFLLPFRAMDYSLWRKAGISIFLAKEPKAIITGEQTRKIIEQMNCSEKSGAGRVSRVGEGSYEVNWSGIDYSESHRFDLSGLWVFCAPVDGPFDLLYSYNHVSSF